MIKARHHTLRVTPKQSELLRKRQMEAAACWNSIVSLAKAYYEANGGKWIGKSELQKQIKNKFKLHSQTAQALADKFVANRRTAAALRRNGDKDARYPYHEKKYLTIPFKQAAIRYSDTGTLVLTLSAGVHFDTGFVPPGTVRTAEVIWQSGKYILSCAMDCPEAELIENGMEAGIDMGEINPVAVCCENGEGLIISGREIRSVKQQRNKVLAKLSKMISRRRKGSRRFRQCVKARQRFMGKSDNRVRNLLHHATRKAIDYCAVRGIANLAIGDPGDTAQRTRKDHKLSKYSRQKVGQWESGTIKKYLSYKAKEAGIKTYLVDETDTSKECPVCGRHNYPRGRKYKCAACGFEGHRDGIASFNMLRKKMPDLETPVFRFVHVQSIPRYRKRVIDTACVVGPDVVPSSSAIAESLCGTFSPA